MNPTESIRSTMLAAGISYGGPIHVDGKLHRFRPEGSRNPTGWYILHAGEVVRGVFACWKRGNIKHPFVDGKFNSMPEGERARLREQWAQEDAKREQREHENGARARMTAGRIMAAAKPVKTHPYLAAKGIKVPTGIRLHDEGRLIIPLRAGSILTTLQYIDDKGVKMFLSGGQVKGASFEIHGDAGPLIICEGLATGTSINEATGFPVLCAMNCGNMAPVARAARTLHPARQIIIAGDDDRNTAGNPGRTAAEAAAVEVGAVAVFPIGTERSDFNDLHVACGLDEVRTQVKAAIDEDGNQARLMTWLAGLEPMDYERCRDSVASQLGCRVGVLDEQVRLRRAATADVTPTPASWPEPVDGGVLLDDIKREILRFCWLPKHCADALAAWILQTYVYEVFNFCGVVVVHSPEPQCGKGRVLEVVQALCRNGFSTSNTSAAVLYHKVSKGGLTVLIDELDSQSEEQRFAIGNVLKSGFQSNGKAHRMAKVNDKQEVVEFPTYCPKIVASIGLDSLDKASRSRAISIPMQRKPRGTEVEKFRRYDGSKIRAQCQRWATDSLTALRSVDQIQITECATDRQEDVWEPLLGIGRVIGPDWEKRLRGACQKMCGGHDGGSDSLAHSILAACREFFRDGPDKVPTKDLCAWLNSTDLSGCNNGRGVTAFVLARNLASYGITPGSVRLPNGKTPKGYHRVSFEAAFEAYLPPTPGDPGFSKRHNATPSANIGQNGDFENATETKRGVSENSIPTNIYGPCGVVAEQKQETPPEWDNQPALDL